MPTEADVYRVLIASPSDVKRERQKAREVVIKWNGTRSHNDVYLEPVMWETHAAADLGKEPQKILNDQIVDSCDFVIGMFWKRVGTETENEPGGAVEEIKRVSQDGSTAIVGFSERDASLSEIDSEQLDRVMDFRKECEKNGLVFTYESLEEFENRLSQHLAKTMNQLLSKNKESDISFTRKTDDEDSYYDPEIDPGRLKIQAQMHLDLDERNVQNIVKHLEEKKIEPPFRVLDAGCGYGNVTKHLFGDRDEFDVLAVDNSEESISIAKKEYSSENIDYKALDINNIHEKEVGDFDIIFSAFLFHHLKNKESVMSQLWELIPQAGGGFLIRSVEDGLHMHYPPDEDLEYIMQKSDQIKKSSDRTHGRRLYTQLKRLKPSPEQVDVDFKIHDTAGLNSHERKEYFEVFHSYRNNPIERLVRGNEATPADERLYEKMNVKMDSVKERFIGNEHFLDIKPVPVAVAYK